MSFNPNHHKNEKSFSIKLVTDKGNLVGFINLNSQFCKAVLGKEPEALTANDILSINHNNFQGYINKLEVQVTETNSTQISIDEY